MSRPLVAGNWKLNPQRLEDALRLARDVAGAADRHGSVEVGIFPPTVWLRAVAEALGGRSVVVGAQDAYWERSGAFTGATSVAMLAGWCPWTLVGHSERRQYFGMTDDDVARSTAAAVEVGLSVMVCVGEHLDQYEAGRTQEVVTGQVRAALARVGPHTSEIAFAYEPVWAIGSGRTPAPDQVGEVLDLIRSEAVAALDGGGGPRVLYGGSVRAANVASFSELPVCDGVLVGGASLDAEEFGRMMATVSEGSE